MRPYVIDRRFVLGGIVACALAAFALFALVDSGNGQPSVAQLRATVQRYLDAQTPAERCQLFTTVYRTENPNVVLQGGCQVSEQTTAAEQQARQSLRISHVSVSGDEATVTFAPVSSGGSSGASSGVPSGGDTADPGFTGLYLQTEAGQWRIDGFTETQSGAAGSHAP